MKKDKALLDKELEELSPQLRAMRTMDDGFSLPANYFDSLEDEVFQQIDAIGARRKPATRTPRPGFWTIIAGLWQPRLAMLYGAILVIAFATWWAWHSPATAPVTPNAPIANQEEATPDELEAYVLENALDFEPEQLAALAMLDEEPEPATARPGAQTPSKPKTTPKAADDLTPEELELLINDLTDEEIEKML